MIGSCPAFAILVNAFRAKAPTHSYRSQGYRKHNDNGPSGTSTHNEIQLGTVGAGTTLSKDQRRPSEASDDRTNWAHVHSSQEKLAADHEGIMVTTTVRAERKGHAI